MVPDSSFIPSKRLDVKTIFLDQNWWEYYLYTHLDDLEPYQVVAIADMLHCGETFRSHTVFECECGNVITVPYTCKGRSCSRCGNASADIWGRKLVQRLLRVKHRHLIFTLPDSLWPIVQANHDWRLPAAMMKAVARTMQRMFDLRYTGSKVIPGIIVIYHPLGRDLKFNPHVHILITQGGLNRTSYGGKGSWCNHYMWKYHLMRQIWQAEVISEFRNILRTELKTNYEWRNIIDEAARHRFSNGQLGFVVKDTKDRVTGKVTPIEPKAFYSIARYICRYVRRPPVSKFRLGNYDGLEIDVTYEWDGVTNQKRVDMETFIGAIVSNIAPKGFQVCRYYGIYANSIMPKVRWQLKGLGMKFGPPRKPTQRKLLRGPFCDQCNRQMQMVYSVHETREGVVKRYGEAALMAAF